MTPEQAAKLTDEVIRVKAAELDGWRRSGRVSSQNGTVDYWRRGEVVIREDELPDYPGDLNAVNEVWGKLDDEEKQRFWKTLVKITGQGRPFNAVVYSYRAAGAKARQRCEALLVTLDGRGE